MRKLVGCSLAIGLLAFSVDALGGTPKPAGTPTVTNADSFSLLPTAVSKAKTNRDYMVEPCPPDAPVREFFSAEGTATAGPTSLAYSASGDTGTAVFFNWNNANAFESDNAGLGGGFASGDSVVGHSVKFFRSSADPGNVPLADVFVCLTMGDTFQVYDTPGNGYGDGSCITGTEIIYSGIPVNTVATATGFFPKVQLNFGGGAEPRVWVFMQSNACRLGWRISAGGVSIGNANPDDVWEICDDETGVGNCCNPGNAACDVAGGTPCPNDATGSRTFCSDGVADDCGLFFFGGTPLAIFNARIYAPAQGIFHLQPIACRGNTCTQVAKDEIAMRKPGGQVIFDLMLSNWSTTDGTCDLPANAPCQRDSDCDQLNGGVCLGGPERLQTWQAQLMSTHTTYVSADCDDTGNFPRFPFSVAGNLRYSNSVTCSNNAQCAAAFGTGANCSSGGAVACNFGANGATDPACDVQNFAGWDSECLNTNVCTRVCRPGFQNTNRADWMHHGIASIAAVDLVSCNYRYGSTMGDPLNEQGPYTDVAKPKVYGGNLVLDVEASARGTAIVGFDTSGFNSFMIDQAGPNIPLIGFESGKVTVEVGSCCYNLGPGTSQCSDNLLENECNAHATTNTTIWTSGAACAGDQDQDGDDDSCPSCTQDSDCDDGDFCTDDTCVNFICNYVPHVCDDNNVCTDDSCDSGQGACVFANNSAPCDDALYCNGADTCDGGSCSLHAGDPCQDGLGCTNERCDEPTDSCVDLPDVDCDDANPCTYDTCVEPAGTCSNVDINTIACDEPGLGDTDCLIGGTQYECAGGFCVCVLCPDITVSANDSCYDAGEKVSVAVNKTAGPASGAQLAIQYDPSCLQFVSISPGTSCGGVAFGFELYEQVNQSTGSIFYAVGVALGQGNEQTNADVLACIQFTRKNDCDNCNVCVVEGNNPYDTRLTDGDGQDPCQPPSPPLALPACSGSIGLNRTVTLDIPDGSKHNADCDANTALVDWDPPSASSTCGDGVTLACTGTHESGYIYPQNVVLNGGELAIGTNTFCCTATGTGKCAGSASGCWTVEVNDQTTLDVVVQLSPLLETKPTGVTRCIKFEAYWDCVQEPVVFTKNLLFGGLFDLMGHFTDTIKIPVGQFACLTARDQHHTLRSCYLVGPGDCVNGVLHAVFKGDPFFGGNWLIGGNLDGWKKDNPNASHDVIDILDFGQFISQYLKTVPQDTPCGAISGTHADINGDGLVDSQDFTFISMNFLESSKDCCCPGSSAASVVPVTAVSVEDLRAWDLADLSVADLNRDGFVDMDDMTTFMQGGGPTPKGAPAGVKGSTVRPSGGSR